MNLFSDKKGQLFDMEVLTSVGFILLFLLAAGATVTGYVVSKKMDMVSMPLWQVLIMIFAEFVGAYFFASRG